MFETANLEPLDRTRHQGLRLGTTTLRFAADLTTVPLAASEVVAAARCFPVVFSGNGVTPHALLALRPGGNLFVDADGTWRAGCYLPAHLRRYPFILGKATGANMSVYVDRACPALSETEGRPLFTEQGEPSDMLQQVISFLQRFQADLTAGETLLAPLGESGLLEARRIEVTLSNGQVHRVDGFRAIVPEKLRALPAETVVAWHASGLLELVYAVQASMGTVKRLAELDVQRHGMAEAPAPAPL